MRKIFAVLFILSALAISNALPHILPINIEIDKNVYNKDWSGGFKYLLNHDEESYPLLYAGLGYEHIRTPKGSGNGLFASMDVDIPLIKELSFIRLGGRLGYGRGGGFDYTNMRLSGSIGIDLSIIVALMNPFLLSESFCQGVIILSPTFYVGASYDNSKFVNSNESFDRGWNLYVGFSLF